MPKPFPCPNPRCKHVFAPGQVGAAAVTCPACGVSFRLRTGAKAPPPLPPAPPPAAAPEPAPPARRRPRVALQDYLGRHRGERRR